MDGFAGWVKHCRTNRNIGKNAQATAGFWWLLALKNVARCDEKAHHSPIRFQLMSDDPMKLSLDEEIPDYRSAYRNVECAAEYGCYSG